ncbi:hypothetical protein R1sor_027384 [Riccia sorocarpa]|uniref:Protein kinase domain-containing protein n=1 Tax=Riccia sorocarpa TaxID=122646 RepID=A0ABD3GFJ7_9MARC
MDSQEGICLSQQLSQVRLANPQNTTDSSTDWTVRALRDDLPCMSLSQAQSGFQDRKMEGEELLGEGDCSQDYVLCTPDFITPVDQFCIDFDSSKENVPAIGSLAAMTPMRTKRPRPDMLPVLLASAKKAGTAVQSTSTNEMLEFHGEGLVMPEKNSELESVDLFPQNTRARLSALRRRVQSPTCLKNPFLPESEEVALTQRRKTPGLQGSYVGGSGLSRYRDDFHEIQEVGRGCFSRVFKTVNRIDGCFYAVKRSHRQLKLDSERKEALTEVQALAAIGAHRNIVRYHTAWFENDYLYIQTELCECNLSEMRAEGKLSVEKSLIDVLWQITQALAVVHSCGLAHLDVKPDNIYFTNGTFKLGDFGRATRLDGTITIEEGDSRYASLEIINDDYSDLHKADIFALGATMYELSRGLPLPSSGTQFQAIRHGKLNLLPGYSTPYQNLLKDMMNPDPGARPSAEELLKHHIFKKVTGGTEK